MYNLKSVKIINKKKGEKGREKIRGEEREKKSEKKEKVKGE